MGILNSNLKHETTKSKYQKSFLIILQMFQAVNETIRKCYTPLGKYQIFKQNFWQIPLLYIHYSQLVRLLVGREGRDVTLSCSYRSTKSKL